MIEISESMEGVAFREFAKVLSVEETAKKIEHLLDLIQKRYENM